MSEERSPTMFSNFVNNIESKISSLTTLEIKTIVGDYKLEANDTIVPKKDGDFRVIQSKIQLLLGDITTYISDDLVTDKYAWLRDFHARKEERGFEIIEGNIKAIVSLFELYRKTKGFKFNEEGIDETKEIEGV